MAIPILICSDRDGTINHDENYYLGSSPEWRSQIEFMPGVIEGIRLLNRIPDAHFYITTNQAGVALSGERFDALTEERAREVNDYIVHELTQAGCRVDGIFTCPYVTSAYVEKIVGRGWTVNPTYVRDDAPCLKPNIGMLEEAARTLGNNLASIKKKFFIGDRASDVETGLNAGAVSFLVESPKTHEHDDVARVHAFETEHPGRVHIVPSFLAAAEKIRQLSVVSTQPPV